jgi:hypothetical protein
MKNKKQIIDLGDDGYGHLTVQYSDPWGFGNGIWSLYRDGKEIRAIDREYLEQKLINKILELQK